MIWIVVSKYNEDISWLTDCTSGTRVVVVNKGASPVNAKCDSVIEAVNVGREAHSYALFCATNYDDLADDDLVVFLQGNPHDHLLAEPVVCDRDGAPHHPGLFLADAYAALRRVMGIGRECPTQFAFHPGAQFSVNGRCVRGYAREQWKNLERTIVETRYGVHGHGAVDAWQMERFWPIVFSQSSPVTSLGPWKSCPSAGP